MGSLPLTRLELIEKGLPALLLVVIAVDICRLKCGMAITTSTVDLNVFAQPSES